MFQIRQAGAKGFGIFASRHIAQGTRILAERPLVTVSDANPDILTAAGRLTPEDKKSLLLLSFNTEKRSSPWSLVDATWKSLLSWSSHGTAKAAFTSFRAISQSRDILNIFYNNNFALGDRQKTRALFPTIARLNHSCTPNTQGNFNTNLGSFTIHALRDITGGDELTISYLHDESALREARQNKLRDGYGFDCACSICDENSSTSAESHERRSRLHHRLAAFAEQQQLPPSDGLAEPPGKAQREELALTLLIIAMYEQEGLAGRELASLYSAAAGLAAKLGNHMEAFNLGAKSLELEKDAVGEDSPLYENRRLEFQGLNFGDEITSRSKSLSSRPKETDTSLSYAPWT